MKDWSYLYFCIIICLCLHGIYSKSGPFRSSRRKQSEPSVPGDLDTIGYRHYKYSEHHRDRSLVDNSKSESPNTSTGHLYYLFMIENVFLNDNVWKEYFAQIGVAERHKIRTYIHASNTDAHIPPYLDAVEVPRIESHRCVDTILIMLSLLRASVANSTDDNDVFAFIAADTIPIKPFSETWQHFANRQNARSSICLYPIEDWERQDNNANILLPRQYPWMVLTRADALKLVSKSSQIIQDIRKEFSQYSLLLNYDELSPRCLDEYWFFKVLYGEIDVSSSTSSSSPQELPYGITLTGNTEQGECNTFVYSENSDSDSIFRKSIRRTNVKSRNQVMLSVTMQFLSDIRRSPLFFFVRRFHSHDIKFTITDRTQSTHSLVDALSKLHVYSRSVSRNASHSNVLNASFIDRLESFSSIKWRPKFNGGGDNGGLRVLMISIDNRPLHEDVDKNDYISYAAVLSHEYCKFHGYDYLQFTPNNTLLANKANNRYNTTFQAIYGDKYGLSVFNTYLRHARSSSWAKLPVLWYLTMLFGEMYDYFWFMDSDATINPLRRTRSLYDALTDWSADSSTQVVRGVKDPRDATFVFLSNFPWRDDLPCAGIMIFKPIEAEPILREWWDYNIPDKNFYDFMEQDALWYMLEAPESYHFLMNFETSATLVVENQFPSAWKGVTELWTTHIPNYEASRNQYFRNMLRLSSIKFRETYSAVINYILRREHMVADIFDIALAMEDYDYAMHHRNSGNVSTKRAKDQYPPCLAGRADDIWHTARNTHLRPAQPPRGRLYNYLPIAIPPNRAIWLILNDTRRAFPSMDSFIKMGFDLDMVLHFSGRDPANSIPVGADLHD